MHLFLSMVLEKQIKWQLIGEIIILRKESYKKAISRFSEVNNKSLDVLRKLGRSYFNISSLDSAEKVLQDSIRLY